MCFNYFITGTVHSLATVTGILKSATAPRALCTSCINIYTFLGVNRGDTTTFAVEATKKLCELFKKRILGAEVCELFQKKIPACDLHLLLLTEVKHVIELQEFALVEIQKEGQALI